MSITATIQNDTIKLPPGVHWPDGMLVRVEPVVTNAAHPVWPAGYFEQTAGALVGESLERPAQGCADERESW